MCTSGETIKCQTQSTLVQYFTKNTKVKLYLSPNEHFMIIFCLILFIIHYSLVQIIIEINQHFQSQVCLPLGSTQISCRRFGMRHEDWCKYIYQHLYPNIFMVLLNCSFSFFVTYGLKCNKQKCTSSQIMYRANNQMFCGPELLKFWVKGWFTLFNLGSFTPR